MTMKQVISDAIASHLDWTQTFNKEIASGKLSERTYSAGYDDLCAFGKWLYSLDDDTKYQPAYRKVKDLHYQFHTVAGEIVELMKHRAFARAKRLLESDYTLISMQLQVALREWQDLDHDKPQKPFHTEH